MLNATSSDAPQNTTKPRNLKTKGRAGYHARQIMALWTNTAKDEVPSTVGLLEHALCSLQTLV